MTHRARTPPREFRPIHLIASLIADQEDGQHRIARKAADMSGENAFVAAAHRFAALADRPGEPDVAPGPLVEHDLDPAGLPHPFQTMIAIFAAEGARCEARRGIA